MADPKLQGDDEDDRPEPTEAEREANRKLVEDIRAGRRTVPTYSTEDLRPRAVGPEFDSDFEPRRRKFNKGGAVKHGSSTQVACSPNKIVR